MDERAIRGVPWTLAAYGANKAGTLATTVTLAHFLDPGDFGLMALAGLVVTLLTVLGNSGLSNTLVLEQDLTERGKGTILTVMIVGGCTLAALGVALSPLVAAVFDQPELTAIVAALSVTVVLWMVGHFYEALLQRELEFRSRFLAHLAFGLAFALAGLVFAVLGAGVWSLVAAQSAAILAFALVGVALAPGRVRPAFDPAAARAVYRPSRNFLIQGLVAFGLENADYFAIGRALGVRQVGFYSLAYRLGELPSMAIADPVARVTFSAFARMRHRGEDVIPAYLDALRLVSLVACPLGILLSATADPFTRAVFGDEWLPMIGPLGVLGLWAAVRPVQVTVHWLLNSAGGHGLLAVIGVVSLAVLVPVLLAAAAVSGATAVAWVMLGHACVSAGWAAWAVRRQVGLAFGRHLLPLRALALACAAAWIVARVLVEVSDGAAPGFSLLLAACGGTVAYLCVLRLVEPPVLGNAVRQVRRMAGRPAVL